MTKPLQILNNIQTKIKHSITKKLLIVVFSGYLVLTAIITLGHMYFEYQTVKNTAKMELARFQAMVTSSLANAIWNVDYGQVNLILQGFTQSSFVVGAKIIPNEKSIPPWYIGSFLDENNQIKYLDENKQIKKMPSSFMQLIPHEFSLVYFDWLGIKDVVELGKVSIYSSNKIVFEQVKIGFLLIIINAIIKTIALWIFFLWSGYIYVSKPLATVTKSIQEVDLEKLNYTKINAPLNKNKNITEIDILINTFNKMIEKLHFAQEKNLNFQTRLESIINSVPFTLVCLNEQGIITNYNKKALSLLNIVNENIIGYSIEHYPFYMQFFEQAKIAIKSNEIQQKNKSLEIINGERKYFNITIYPVKYLNSHEAVIILYDITEQMALESTMIQMEKMTSLGTLAAGMAHEINNPLGSMLQSIQNIRRRINPSLQKNQELAKIIGLSLEQMQEYMNKRGIIEFIEGIRQAGEHAASIVKSVLAFSHRDDGEMITADINDILEKTLHIVSTDYTFKKEISAKEIKIVKYFDTALPKILCYPSGVEQVFFNLIQNALYALHEKKTNYMPTLTICSRKLNDNILIEIEDNGLGIDEKTKKRLFDPFFTTKPIGVGTGLGLYLSYSIIVEKHKGKLEVESELGVRTKFIIKLPITLSA